MAAHCCQGGDACSAGGRIEALADHLLGYRTTAEPDVERRGPQPPEGILSVLLQEFPAYTLRELLDEDWLTLEQILDYRRAKLAIDLFNGGEQGLAELAKREDLTAILLEMGRAQAGDGLTLQHMLANKAAETDEDDDDG